MKKWQRIIQKLNMFLLLFLLLLMLVALVQGYLSSEKEPELFLGTFAIPWVAFLGIVILCFRFFTAKKRQWEKTYEMRPFTEGILLALMVAFSVVVIFLFREKITLGEKGWLLLKTGAFCFGEKNSGLGAGVLDYLSTSPGQIIFGCLFYGLFCLLSDVDLAGLLMQMLMIFLIVMSTYFLTKKISNRTAGFFGSILLFGMLIWNKSAFFVDGRLCTLLFVLLAALFFAKVFVKQEEEVRFGKRDLCFLLVSGIFLALATLCEQRTVFLLIPFLLFAGVSGEKSKKQELTGESILESKGILCMVFFFAYGILTVFLALCVALLMQHTLRISLPVDVGFWEGWFMGPVDGILAFFYKLENVCLGRSTAVYAYGFSLSILLMAFIQLVILFIKNKVRPAFSAYMLLCLLVLEVVMEQTAGNRLLFLAVLCILAGELSGSLCEAMKKIPLKAAEETVAVREEPEEEKVMPITAGNETAETETAGNETAGNETAENETVETETAENETVETETADEVMENVQELKEKILKLEAMVVSQQVKISRMEEMMKEQRLLAKKRERRLRQELAIARNKETERGFGR